MRKHIKYIGGPKHGQRAWAELADFPEQADGGEYHHSGLSYSTGSGAPDGPLPEATKSSAVWQEKL
jgi:hypothetical protein